MPAFDADQLRRDNPLSEYLPTRGIGLSPDGAEFRACCPFHAERTPSFTVYQGRKRTQEFHCFGCGEKGDVIDFVRRYDGVEFTEACEILGGTRTTDPARVPASTSIERIDIYAAWKARMPGADAPPIEAGKRTPPLANPKRPEKPVTHYTPTAVYPYHHSDGRVVGYVLRVEIKGKKLTPLILWCENTETGELTWCHRPFAAPRRLYNLPAFAAMPDAQVLVVEGEKCAEAGKRILPRAVVTTWQGGGKAAGKSDWSPVRGRDVLIWPDADPEGLEAAQEAASLAQAAGASRVRIITPPSDKPKGWDIADAEAEGWTRADVVAFARAEAREPGQARRTPDHEPQPPEADRQRFDEPAVERDGERPSGPATRPALKPVEQEKPQPEPESKPRPKLRLVRPDDEPSDDWMQHLELDQHNRPVKKLMRNVIAYLKYHPSMSGCIARNVFSSEIMLMRRPPWDREGETWTPRAMIDADFVSAVAWLDGPRMDTNKGTVTDAVLQIAHEQRFDPVREYLDTLRWDGVPRLLGDETRPGWLTRYLGVKTTKTGIEAVFGFRWLIAAVARNRTQNPAGAKVDNMLVIEGRQGLRKSTALETLATLGGNRWFTSGVNDVRSKDGLLQMQGCLIVEMDELAALGKADVEKVKSFISTQQDDIRPPYGRRVEKMPRRFVLAGTMNPRGMGYLPDSTGNRRFWPVFADTPADIEALERDRDQLWAEADAHYQGGEPWWLQGEEVQHAEAEQRKRFQSDPWADDLDEWLGSLAGVDPVVTLKQAFQVLNIPTHQRTSDTQSRVVNHLTQAGWVRATITQDGGKRVIFRRPAQ